MQFIVVAEDDLAAVARQLVHGLSLAPRHHGAFWSLRRYRDNEDQITSKQPVIFLGENEIAASYLEIFPERFQGHGTRCLFAGAKAVLVAELPADVNTRDIRNLRRVIDGNTGGPGRMKGEPEVHDDDDGGGFWGTCGVAGVAGAAGAAGGLGVLTGAFALPVAVSLGVMFASDRRKARRHTNEYRELQYKYVSRRFLREEFDDFVNSIDQLR